MGFGGTITATTPKTTGGPVDQRRRIDYMPLTEVQRAPRNPRTHNVELIAGSITRFGIVESPALDERTGRLVAGHGRLDDWTARRDAGEKAPDGIEVDPGTGDWLVPVQRGWASRNDVEAEAYLIISNSSGGGWDDAGLAQILADLRDEDLTLLPLTGYNDKFIGKHLDAYQNPWDVAPPLTDEPEQSIIGVERSCPQCGHQWTEKSGG